MPQPAQSAVAVEVRVAAQDEDLASGLLFASGTLGIEVRTLGPDAVALLAYFEPRPQLVEELRAALRPCEPLAVESAPVAQVDWVARFREGFRAFEAGGFRVLPVWEAEPARPGLLIVDPGRAFGTGTHETTRLCLGLLAEQARRAPLGRVLDVGCGTGILAVAARQLGATRAVALDFDPEATASARRHARLNGVELDVLLADGGRALRAGTFDLLLANLMAPLLLERRDELHALVAPGGGLILSGLLVTDLPDVRAAFGALGALEERRDGEWAALGVRLP